MIFIPYRASTIHIIYIYGVYAVCAQLLFSIIKNCDMEKIHFSFLSIHFFPEAIFPPVRIVDAVGSVSKTWSKN